MPEPKSRWYGPFHRLQSAELNELVATSNKLWGRPSRNVYAGRFPAVRAFVGPLPPGRTGIEFETPVRPGPASQPDVARWYQGDPGVESIEGEDAVAISVRILKRMD